MKIYADSNLLIRLYLPFQTAPEMGALLNKMQSAKRPFPVTWLHQLEVTNSFQYFVFAGRTSNQARITPEQAAAAQESWRADIKASTFLRIAQPELRALENCFEDLALRHTAKHGFRTYDIVHVALALLLECDRFWSFDKEALQLASLEGLKTI